MRRISASVVQVALRLSSLVFMFGLAISSDDYAYAK